MKLKIIFLTFIHLSVCSSDRVAQCSGVSTVPNILEMQRMQERAEQERISQERKNREKKNKQIILDILNKNLRTDLNNNPVIAEGLARQIEIFDSVHDLELREKVKKYLIEMNAFSKKK